MLLERNPLTLVTIYKKMKKKTKRCVNFMKCLIKTLNFSYLCSTLVQSLNIMSEKESTCGRFKIHVRLTLYHPLQAICGKEPALLP